MEFRFETYERVKVVNSGEQYTTYWEAYGKLMHGCAVGAWGNSFIIGAHLSDENLENTVFQIIASNRIDTAYGERNLYLITSQSDYDALESRKVGEKGEPAKIYVIGEGGLEKAGQKVFLVGFYPNTAKVGVRIVDSWPSLEAYTNTGNKVEMGDVKEDFFNNSPKAHRLLVAVSALNRDEATKKGMEFIKEYLTEKVNRLSEERTEVEWMLGKLDEKLEDEEEQS